jgi:pimeloyl-ACP methyl ester carboxylesterase
MNFYNYNEQYEWMVEERARMAKGRDFEDFCYAVVRSVHGMLDEPTTKRLSSISVPTHLIFGENDGLIPNPILHGGSSSDVAKIGTDAIPNVTLNFIPAAGHMLQIEKPAEFNAIIRDLVK